MKKIIILLFLIAMPACVFAKTTFEIGKDYFYKKDYTMAKAYLEKEIRKNPNNYHCHYFLGLTYNHTKENEKAKTEFKKVLSQAPKQTMVYQYAEAALKKLEPETTPQKPANLTPASTPTPTQQTTSKQKENTIILHLCRAKNYTAGKNFR